MDDDDDEVDEWAEEEEEINPETAAKKRRMGVMKEHLDLLAQDSYHFVKCEGNRGLGEWSIDFAALGKTMKQVELEKIIEQRFGTVATRLLRILKEKGKLDEKQVLPPYPPPSPSMSGYRETNVCVAGDYCSTQIDIYTTYPLCPARSRAS